MSGRVGRGWPPGVQKRKVSTKSRRHRASTDRTSVTALFDGVQYPCAACLRVFGLFDSIGLRLLNCLTFVLAIHQHALIRRLLQ